MGVAQGPQTHGVRRAINETEFACQLTLAQDGEARVVSAGPLDDLDLTVEDRVQGVVAATVFDQEIAVGQVPFLHQAAQELDFPVLEFHAQRRVLDEFCYIIHAANYPLRKIRGQLGLATLGSATRCATIRA